MSVISLLIVLLLPIVGVSGEPPDRPKWFPMGTTYRSNNISAEVHQEYDHLTVQTNVLQIITQPRWFKGVKPSDSILDIPTTNQGASLSLQIRPTDNPILLHLVLTLKADERSVWREIEHRWTNIIPFLFALTVDGKPISPQFPRYYSKSGGMRSMIELVPSGKSKTWNILLDARSITSALDTTRRKRVTIVAAFSEYQHEFPALFDENVGDVGLKGDFKGPPIIVRSNEVVLEYEGEMLKQTGVR